MRNTYASVSLGTIKNNTGIIKENCGDSVAVCAVIKADAYGHGMVKVAEALSSTADYFAVALVTEGKLLRENNITLPILLLGSIDKDEIEDAIQNNLTITAASIDKLTMIAEAGKKVGIVPTVHLKIDTGMGRVGVNWERKESFIALAKAYQDEGKINCEGIYSHFADSVDDEYTQMQFDRFKQVTDFAESLGFRPKYFHICSSRAIFVFPQYHLDMVRPGIAIYGIEPECESSVLPETIRPALELKTKITYFKAVKKDDAIGYGKTYRVKEDIERVVTLPLGYADGYPRRLSNCGHVLIRGKKFPIVGRVCMDQFMVSVGAGGEAYTGDTVTLIGSEDSLGEKKEITVQEIATIVGTAPHEITTCLSARVPRIYID
ncbi:MAG: alanine racemase [Candidatus Pacebacteria bacterium]|nr:alanine racemase [Candidatus Paceibacterota bacterium]